MMGSPTASSARWEYPCWLGGFGRIVSGLVRAVGSCGFVGCNSFSQIPQACWQGVANAASGAPIRQSRRCNRPRSRHSKRQSRLHRPRSRRTTGATGLKDVAQQGKSSGAAKANRLYRGAASCEVRPLRRARPPRNRRWARRSSKCSSASRLRRRLCNKRSSSPAG